MALSGDRLFDSLYTKDALAAWAKVYPVSSGALTTGYVVTVQADGTLAFAAAAGGGALSDGDYGDIVVSASGTVLTIDTNVVGDTKLRQGAATSVIGRSANSTGNVADIAASADGQLLVRRSAALTWGTLVAADIPNLAASIITSGTLAIARGGTNLGSYAKGDVVYASATNVLSALAGATGHDGYVITWNDSSGVPEWRAAAAASIGVDKNGSLVGTRGTINLVEGSGVSLTVIDNSGSNRVDVTITNTTAAGGGVTILDVDEADGSPTSETDEFNGSTSTFDSTYTRPNWSGLTAYDVNSTKERSLWASAPATAGGTFTWRAALIALPAGDFSIFTKVWVQTQIGTGGSEPSVLAGLLISDGTTAGAGNQLEADVQIGAAAGTAHCARYTNFGGAAAATPYSGAWPGGGTAYIRMRRSGTNYFVAWSMDGRTWFEPAVITLSWTAAFFGVAIRADSNSGGFGRASWDFLRYYSSATASIGGTRSD